MPKLLAIDLGLKTGFALYGDDGRLLWYRSQNFGTTERLRRGAQAMLSGIPDLAAIVIEGGGRLAVVWEKEAERHGLRVRKIGAEAWRQLFLLPREQRKGTDAKKNAGELARKVIAWSGAQQHKSLRHDAAEAILIGLWGVLQIGWVEAVPAEVSQK